MPLTNAGINYICAAITAQTTAAFVPFTTNNAYIGLGSSNTAGTTALVGNTVAFAKTTTVSVSSNVIAFTATFSTSSPNAAMNVNEWSIQNSASTASGTMLSRATTSLGSKTTTASWVVTATHTWGVGS